MKALKKITGLAFLAFVAVFLLRCQKHVDTREPCDVTEVGISEAKLLVEYLEKNGDPVNCKQNCTVTAREVHDQLQGNQYILDLRSKNAYAASHIPGAVHMPMNKLFFHFEEAIKPMRYDRIVLACYTGQSAAYAASLLRMLGYQNVFSLKWGMASWNEQLAKKWTDHPRVKEPLALSQKASESNGVYDLPEITTGEKWRKDILKSRVKKLLAGGYSKVSVPADALHDISAGQVVVAYCPNQVYDRGHVPGAIHFPLKESLARNADLLKLPVDKEILVYSENGFESAYAVAFLQLLGYDAKTVQFGMNAFAANHIHGFNRNEVHQYALVDQGNQMVFEEKMENVVEKKEIVPAPRVIVPQNQEEEGEEGC